MRDACEGIGQFGIRSSRGSAGITAVRSLRAARCGPQNQVPRSLDTCLGPGIIVVRSAREARREDQIIPDLQSQEGLVKERAVLSNTVRELNKDISKLEVFRKTLMRSLAEDEENPVGHGGLLSRSLSFKFFVVASIPHIVHIVLLASQTSTPRLTPPGSPPIFSASTSPTRSSKPVSPRRHSMSFATSSDSLLICFRKN
ncbi:hypothetical protein C1H46_036168 [Malus baccata]|uniref:Uncharacterized protein n=1 Tax=Malus baccata TaxID=106549 RepID=A0A540KW95_MALBA|nr:hypothetical protein C1H46_036168 [Malus baccata]